MACPDSDRARLWRLQLAQRLEVIEARIQRLEAQKQLRIARLTDNEDTEEVTADVPSG